MIDTRQRGVAQRRQQEAEQASEQARRQQARAEKYYQLAIQTVDQFLTQVADDDRLKAVGLENLRRDLLVQARDFYELVIEQASEKADQLHAERANALQQLAEISSQVGDYPAAIEAYKNALLQMRAMDEKQVGSVPYVILLNDYALSIDAAGSGTTVSLRQKQSVDTTF